MTSSWKGENGWEPPPFPQGTLTLWPMTASRPRSPWPGCNADELGERPIDAYPGRYHASIASPRLGVLMPAQAPGGDITEFTQHGGCLVEG